MNRKEALLRALSAAPDAIYTPVQVQKLMFLLQQNTPDILEGADFSFSPYHYGPFDSQIYRDMESLEAAGLISIERDNELRYNRYRLTPDGKNKAAEVGSEPKPEAAEYLRKVNEFVRATPFSALVRAIYKQYPEMKANSVFGG